MIYKSILENNSTGVIIQDPNDIGVDLDAVEKAIAGENGINAHQDDVDDAINGMIGDPVEEFAMIIYESEYNYNQIMEAIGMAELKESAMGRDLVLEGANIKGFFIKIKEFFKNMFERFTEVVRNIITKLNIQVKSDKKFVEENKDLIEKGFATDCWNDDEGYDVFGHDLSEYMADEVISIENVDDINKAKERLENFTNEEGINKTFEDLKNLDKKDLVKVILKSTRSNNEDFENLADFRKKLHYGLFGDKVRLKTVIKNRSYVHDTLANNAEGIEIQKQYKKAKDAYKKIFDQISKWEKNATANNIEGKEKYLASCQILTKAFKIERSCSDITFSIMISAYNYKRSVCRKLAHKFVAAAKKYGDATSKSGSFTDVKESASLFNNIVIV